MDITLLHSAQVETSRAIVVELGLPVDLTDANTAMPLGGDPAAIVRVVGKHALAVAACPNFSAYPAIVVRDGESVRVKSPVTSWAEAKAFIEAPAVPPVPPDSPVYVSKTAFTARFTRSEYEAILNAAGKRNSDGNLLCPDVAVAVNTVMMLPEEPGVNLRSQLLAGYAALLVDRELLTRERAAEILTP